MQQELDEDKTIAPLSNVSIFMALVKTVVNRAPDLPGMACFYGPPGFGKTFSATYAANKYRAYNVQVKSVWTRKKLCEEVLKDMGIKPEKSIPAMVDQIAEELATSRRPLIIDEADFLIAKAMIEVVRDIYESAYAPVILIGEENMPDNLRKWERVHNRMLDMKRAQPATLMDTEHLAKLYCPGVDVVADLLEAIHTTAAGCTRRICVSLARVRENAGTLGASSMALADFTGELSSSRKPGRL